MPTLAIDYVPQNSLQTVILTSGESIGSRAFENCDSLMSVIIPASVTSIGSNAFYNCTGLTSVTIGNGVTSIGGSAFYGCNKLIEVYNKSSLDITAGSSANGEVARYAKNIYTEEGGSWFTDTADGFRFFYNGTNGYLMGYYGEETVITLPDKFTAYDDTEVTEYAIYDYAFYNCSGLTFVTILDSVTSIGNYAFYGCSGLTSVTFGDGVTSIGNFAFSGCSGLEAVYITDLSTWCGISFGGSSANPLSYAHNLYLNGELVTGLVIPDSVTNIGDYTFYGCTSLTSVTIPASVTSIGGSAFYGCSGLVSVTIPNSVTSIGSSAFSGCSSLENITIPFVGDSAGKTSSDTSRYPFGYIFGTSSYTGGTAVRQSYYGGSTSNPFPTTYYIPSSLRNVTVTGGNILYGAFQNCSMLTSVTIGNSVTSIGDAFEGCSGLTAIVVEEGNSVYHSAGNCLIETESKELMVGCKTSVIPDDGSVTSIGNRAFYNCTGLTSITIPDSVTSIGSYAFSGCTGLASVTFEATTRWYRNSSGTIGSGNPLSSDSLSNPSTAATLLTSTYDDYYWWRNA